MLALVIFRTMLKIVQGWPLEVGGTQGWPFVQRGAYLLPTCSPDRLRHSAAIQHGMGSVWTLLFVRMHSWCLAVYPACNALHLLLHIQCLPAELLLWGLLLQDLRGRQVLLQDVRFGEHYLPRSVLVTAGHTLSCPQYLHPCLSITFQPGLPSFAA